MATHARQQYFADESSLSKEKREFSIADEIQEKIDSMEEGAQVNKIETIKVNGTALVPDANKAVNVDVPEVIDNLYTVAADDALSAKQGKLLYDYIQNLQTIGRFLSNWDSATGLPITNPSESPYLYKAGDYYRVSNVAVSPALNYKPNGSSFIIGQASTTVETNNINISDLYLYDGTTWILLSNSGSSIAVDSSLSTTSTNPVENRVITNALNGKQETLIAGSNIQIAADGKTISATDTTYSAGANISIDANNEISAVDTTYTAGTNVQISNQNVISATDTKYTAGTGISIDANNEISNTLPGAIVSATAPSNPTEGMVWYDTTEDSLKAYNGTSWETEGTKMVVLEYGVSTWQDFIDAYNENAVVYCKVSSGSSGYRMAFMAYTAGQGTPTEVEFQYYRSRSSHSQSSTQLDEVYVYKLTNAGVWTTTQRDTGAKMIAGTGIGITFNSSGATINNTGVTSVNGNTGAVTVEEVPSGGTEGQVLTQTNNGPAWQNATSGAEIEYVTQAEYNALPSSKLTDNKHYFIYTSDGGGGWQPGANTLAYWKFDGNLNSAFTGGATLSGTPYGYSTGIDGQALDNTNNVQLNSSLTQGDIYSGAFAIAFCVNMQNNTTIQRIFAYGGSPSGSVDIQYEFYNNFSGFQVYTNGLSQRIAFPLINPGIGVWKNIVVTGDGINQIECYIDGVKTNAYSDYNTTFTYPSQNTTFSIRGGDGANNLLDGVIIENKYWTQTDVDTYISAYPVS